MKPDEYVRGIAELQRLTSAIGETLDRVDALVGATRSKLGHADNKQQQRASVKPNGIDKAPRAEVVSK